MNVIKFMAEHAKVEALDELLAVCLKLQLISRNVSMDSYSKAFLRYVGQGQ